MVLAERFFKGRLPAALGVALALMCGALAALALRVMDGMAGRTLPTLLACVAAIVLGGLAGHLSMAAMVRHRLWRPWQLGLLLTLLSGILMAQLALSSGLSSDWQRVLSVLVRSFELYRFALLKTTLLFALLPALVCAAAARAFCQWLPGAHPPGSARRLHLALVGILLAMAGYALGRGILIPTFGLAGTARLLLLWSGALAGLTLPRCGWLPPLAAAAMLLALGSNTREAALAGGAFSRLVHRDSGFARGAPATLQHSARHTVATYSDPDYQSVLTLDGRAVLLGNRFQGARAIASYVPLLLRPECRRLVVMGAEAGLHLPFFERAGVAEITVGGEGRLLRMLRTGCAAGAAAGGAPALRGTHFRVLRGSNDGYDVVYLAPEATWLRGAEGRPSRALLRRCRKALSADGLVALHLDGRLLTQWRLASIVRDFARELPYMQLWCTGAYDWLLIGSSSVIQTPADRMLSFFERDAIADDFARAGVLSLSEAAACMVCDGAGLVPWLSQNNQGTSLGYALRVPALALGQGQVDGTLVTPHTLEAFRQSTLEWLAPGGLEPAIHQALRARALECGEARALAARALWRMDDGRGDLGLRHAREAAAINQRDTLLAHLAGSLELEGRRRIALGEFRGGLKCYENLLSFAAGSPMAHYGMGYCLRANGDNETAYLHFARAVAAMPEQVDYRLELAQVAVALGEYPEADRQYEEVLKREPGNVEAMFRLAKSLAHKDREDKDFKRAIKLAEEVCTLTEWQITEYAYGLADIYMDAGRIMEGMGLKRRMKEGLAAKTGEKKHEK